MPPKATEAGEGEGMTINTARAIADKLADVMAAGVPEGDDSIVSREPYNGHIDGECFTIETPIGRFIIVVRDVTE